MGKQHHSGGTLSTEWMNRTVRHFFSSIVFFDRFLVPSNMMLAILIANQMMAGDSHLEIVHTCQEKSCCFPCRDVFHCHFQGRKGHEQGLDDFFHKRGCRSKTSACVTSE
jgi:hypothetical protein